MNLEKLNLVELYAQEVREIEEGLKKNGDQLYEQADGTWVYYGGNSLVYAGVTLHNAAIKIASWF